MQADRVLLHLDRDLRRVTDPDDIYFLEADGGDTLVRLRGRRRSRDVRRLRDMVATLAPFGFLLIHRSYAINLIHLREIRRRDESRGWEVRLNPPVNRILPVSRSYEGALWAAFGE